jgi:DNA-directed RNA polymerase subunit RPC12/RpoP
MVFNASNKLAVKCSECGKYNVVDINLFKIKIPTSTRCDCGHKMFKAYLNNNDIVLDIDCIACEKQHSYRFKVKDVIERPINIISCPITGMEIAFLGKEGYVDDIVKRYMDDMYELLKFLGVIEEKVTKVVK